MFNGLDLSYGQTATGGLNIQLGESIFPSDAKRKIDYKQLSQVQEEVADYTVNQFGGGGLLAFETQVG
jgi:hypothetical protein